MTDQDQELEPYTGELVPAPASRATVDLRNAVTDSWTDVFEQVARFAIEIAGTDFVPKEFRGKPGQVTAAIMHGREIGFPPMTALANTYSVHGRPSLYAEAMRALVLQAGHEIIVSEASSSRVTVKGRRRGQEEWTSVSWTLDDARQAGIKNPNYRTYPRQMLTARASVELCRMIFPDVLHGMRAAEELMDDVDQVAMPYEPEPVEPEKKTTTVRRRPTKKDAAKTEPKPEPEQQQQEEEKPARKRAELPPRKPRPHPEGENDSVPPTESEETTTPPQPVPDQPDPSSGEAAEIETGRATGPQLTAGQRASVIMHMTRLQVEDRDERLWWTNHFLELEPETITSTNELRQAEAVRLLAKLERFKDRDQLDASLQQDELIPNDPKE